MSTLKVMIDFIDFFALLCIVKSRNMGKEYFQGLYILLKAENAL